MKEKKHFVCKECGADSVKWLGKCPQCHSWNSFEEQTIAHTPPSAWSTDRAKKKNVPLPLSKVESEDEIRLDTFDKELNRVFGGGIVKGSISLIGGEPGIGKSTIMLQFALRMREQKVLYISGEESQNQIKLRADRLQSDIPDGLLIFAETHNQSLLEQTEKINPSLIIIDSIQTLYSSRVESIQGSITQIKQCASEWLHYAKTMSVPVILIGHITKEGSLAGPKALEHMVDTVLHFEGERHTHYRLLRTIKNRFGSTSEIGVYQMQNTGLMPVENPSEMLLSERNSMPSGVAIGTSLEGNRPLMLELQALVCSSNFPTPQRTATGFDLKRLSMLLAIIEKRASFKINVNDVF